MKKETEDKITFWAAMLFIALLVLAGLLAAVVDFMAKWRIAFGHLK